MPAGEDSYLRRVRVELADGFNFAGTVVREYYDSRGRQTLLVEDSRGNQRTVHPEYPSVSVHDLDDGLDDSGGGLS
jgi:hypothetical protein